MLNERLTLHKKKFILKNCMNLENQNLSLETVCLYINEVVLEFKIFRAVNATYLHFSIIEFEYLIFCIIPIIEIERFFNIRGLYSTEILIIFKHFFFQVCTRINSFWQNEFNVSQKNPEQIARGEWKTETKADAH